MANLRALAVTDVREQNLKDWSLPVIMQDPDGNTHNTDAITGEDLKAIMIQYDYRKFNPDTGEEIVINEPIVTMARDSLSRVPLAGERWHLRFPLDPGIPDVLSDFVIDETRAPEGGRSLGFIRLYPHKAEQSS